MINLVVFSYLYKNFGGKKFILDSDGKEISVGKTNKNPALINALVKAKKWNGSFKTGEAKTITDIARANNVRTSYVSRILRMEYLSPNIKNAIMEGTQPPSFSISKVSESFPISWKEQEELFSFQITYN